jgi:hypothetical protein
MVAAFDGDGFAELVAEEGVVTGFAIRIVDLGRLCVEAGVGHRRLGGESDRRNGGHGDCC